MRDRNYKIGWKQVDFLSGIYRKICTNCLLFNLFLGSAQTFVNSFSNVFIAFAILAFSKARTP